MVRASRYILLLLLCLEFLQAQNAVVSGRVVDSTDAAIPNVSLTLTNKGTSVRADTVSNGEGYFVFPPQAPGAYELSATATGFSVARLDAITLEVGQSRTVSLTLKPGEVKESITVMDSAPLLTVEPGRSWNGCRKQVCPEHSSQLAQSVAVAHADTGCHHRAQRRNQHRQPVDH